MSINGCSAINNCTQNFDDGKMTVNIDGKNIELTGNPDKDAQTVAYKLGITPDEAKEKLKAELGEPQQPQQQSGGCSSTKIGRMLSGETSWK